jgi:ADP-ribose pyrophosphatase
MPIEPEIGLSKELVYDGKLFKVYKEMVRLPDGSERPREIVAHPGAVALVVVDDSGRLVLVRQYRRAVGRALLEIPAGTREAGEDPIECARREVREETGYEAANIRRLGGFYSAPGFCTEFLDCYLMTGLTDNPSDGEEDENIEVELLTPTEAIQAIKSGEICDAKSICGIILWANEMRET